MPDARQVAQAERESDEFDPDSRRDHVPDRHTVPLTGREWLLLALLLLLVAVCGVWLALLEERRVPVGASPIGEAGIGAPGVVRAAPREPVVAPAPPGTWPA